MSCLIRHQNRTGGVCGENGCRAALNEDPQLLLGLAARFAFAFDCIEVFLCRLAIAAHFAHKQPRSQKCAEIKNVPGDARARVPPKVVKYLCEESAKRGNDADLPRRKHAA